LTLYGILNLSFWGDVVAVLLLTHITIISTTVYLHRHQAHRALDLHPIISHFFRFWLWFATGTVTKEWTAIHRKHHAKCETKDDPHSPQIVGIRKVLWQGYELYRAEAANQETLERYGQGTPDDWIERHLYTRYSMLGIFLMLVCDLILFGIPGITIWAIQMIWIPFFAAGVINGIGHYWGYRNYECPDQARNIVPWGILIGGEELHNNHHTYASSAKLSLKWWEIDLGWCYIRLLSALKLARVKKVPPQLRSIPTRKTIDAETLKVLIVNRFQVLAHYTKDVILPVFHEEKFKSGKMKAAWFAHAKELLIRAESLIDEASKQRLTHFLEESRTLHIVYHYRTRLQAIWEKTTATQKELIAALQDWCKQAEETGIETLGKFALNLRTYVLHSH
jgi:stearoyl-CoA desaturase (delta-9 desaturase)